MNIQTFINKPLAIRVLKVLLFIAGSAVIFITVNSLLSSNWEMLQKSLSVFYKAFSKIIGFGVPHFFKLVLSSIALIWLPIAIYVMISLITVSLWWRFFLCLVTLCGFILVVKALLFKDFSLKSVPELLIYITQIYLLLLWVIPRELWNLAGGAVWFVESVVVTLLPNLPGYFDDIGIVAAIFAFIFLYLHTIASLVQRVVDKRLVVAGHRIVARLFQGPQPDVTDKNEQVS